MSYKFDAYGNERRNFVCSKCAKQRFLSVEEAQEDGWVVQTKSGINGGHLLCDQCRPTYGIPCNILQCQPSDILLKTDDNGKIYHHFEYHYGR